MKATTKSKYYIIPHQNFLQYLREDELRIKNKSKTLESKIKEFFDCWAMINGMDDEDFMSDEYINELDA